MTLQKTKRSSLVEQIVQQMEDLIESGTWAVGTRIPNESELSEQLGVSRNTVREGIRALVYSGLLVVKQGDGTYVQSNSSLEGVFMRRLTRTNIKDTLEVRNALEQEAARLAALRRGEEELKVLEDALNVMTAINVQTHTNDYLEADIAFHNLIVQCSHNQLLMELYASIIQSVRVLVGSVVGPVEHANKHKAFNQGLVEAIKEKNPDKAAQIVRSYIQETQTWLGKSGGER